MDFRRVLFRSPDVKKDHVIETAPAGGDEVPPGTAVQLTLSNGMVEVPDLTGEHIEDAQEALTDLKLRSIAESIETDEQRPDQDRKSTRLNSSHVAISYAVFCLKKKSTYRE